MLDAALLARYETVARPEQRQWKEWREAQLDKIETSLAALNAHPEWLQNRIDLGSIAIGCALWYLDLRFADYGWRERHPEVAAWYATYSQ
jgi:glutathione S-transferase